jgi:CSLREA domain-containing protein
MVNPATVASGVRSAQASITFTVNSTLDAVDTNPGDGVCATSGGLCTLRAAIMEANHTSGGGATIIMPGSTSAYAIAISPSGSDDDTTGDLNITASTNIVGTPSIPHPYIIIDAGLAGDRAFNVSSGVTVGISHVTIRNGSTLYGGGIENDGMLTLTDSTVSGNTADDDGGGIENDFNATLTLINSTVSGNMANSGYDIGGGIFNHGTLVLTDSTISGNMANYSGGIYNGGTLTLTDSTVSGNTATDYYGGGILNYGALTLINSTVSGNMANGSDSFGGGIYNGGTLTLTNSIVDGNTANIGGGGIDNNSGTLALTNSIVRGNTANIGRGGGILNTVSGYDTGTLTLTDSFVSGNTANGSDGFGGGIDNNDGGEMTLNNSTINSNTVRFGGGGIYNSGVDSRLTVTNATVSGNSDTGIENDYGTADLTNATVSGNSDTGIVNYDGTAQLTSVTINGNSGYGIYQHGSSYTETVTLANTIIANSPTNCYIYAIPLQSSGYNLSSDGSCGQYFNQTGDLNNTNPHLGPLQDNGGSTLTQAPSYGSPAIDAIPLGTNGCGTTLITDQRGVTRPIHGKCDIGAYEVAYFDVFLPLIEK